MTQAQQGQKAADMFAQFMNDPEGFATNLIEMLNLDGTDLGALISNFIISLNGGANGLQGAFNSAKAWEGERSMTIGDNSNASYIHSGDFTKEMNEALPDLAGGATSHSALDLINAMDSLDGKRMQGETRLLTRAVTKNYTGLDATEKKMSDQIKGHFDHIETLPEAQQIAEMQQIQSLMNSGYTVYESVMRAEQDAIIRKEHGITLKDSMSDVEMVAALNDRLISYPTLNGFSTADAATANSIKEDIAQQLGAQFAGAATLADKQNVQSANHVDKLKADIARLDTADELTPDQEARMAENMAITIEATAFTL